jgi:signal transduction histidine kinase
MKDAPLTEEGHSAPSQNRVRVLTGYGLALVSTALAALARWLVPWALAPAPYLGFYPAVVVSSALGGVGPGLVATFFSLVLVNFVFGRFDPSDHGAVARQVIWVTASVGVSILAGMQRSARLRERRQAAELRRWNDELEIRVRERTAEIQDANRHLREANEKLAELDHAKTAFFSNVSHEFRTPLTLMMGTLKEVLGKSEESIPQDIRASLTVANRNALRLLKLVNTLLDFSRIEAGRVQANFEPTDLATLTTLLTSHFQSVCDDAGLRILVDCPTLPEPVYVDREMWEKIVFNLFSNAFKFTFEGQIQVSLRAVDGWAELTVRDTGIGIARQELPHLFERFHRVEGAHGRSYEGSGVGLALVSDLVRLHKGSIHVESEVGSGTTFTVRMPLGKGHLPLEQCVAGGLERPVSTVGIQASAYLEEIHQWLPEEEDSSGAASMAGTRESNGRILVADDNADMRSYIRRLLEAAGYSVETAANGEDALQACKEGLPDLILTDVMMPGMDGFSLLKRLRDQEHTAKAPVIMLSARAGEEAKIEGLAAGADDYLVKPFGAKELVARVDGAIKLSRFRQEATQREHQILAEANAALECSNRALQDFVSIASHDLQEPLRKVGTFANMLRERCGEAIGEQGNSYIERVLDANRRMQSLITALLEYSRLSTMANPFMETDLVQLIQEVLGDLEVRIDRTGGEVHVGDLPTVQADPTQMRQLFQNLIGNALKFHREGEKPIIKVSGSTADTGNLQIIFEDNGIGFDEQFVDKIFAPFQRLHGRSSQYEGTGMGLAICRKIVERHGGAITATSEPGVGSTFIVNLPVKQKR